MADTNEQNPFDLEKELLKGVSGDSSVNPVQTGVAMSDAPGAKKSFFSSRKGKIIGGVLGAILVVAIVGGVVMFGKGGSFKGMMFYKQQLNSIDAGKLLGQNTVEPACETEDDCKNNASCSGKQNQAGKYCIWGLLGGAPEDEAYNPKGFCPKQNQCRYVGECYDFDMSAKGSIDPSYYCGENNNWILCHDINVKGVDVGTVTNSKNWICEKENEWKKCDNTTIGTKSTDNTKVCSKIGEVYNWIDGNLAEVVDIFAKCGNDLKTCFESKGDEFFSEKIVSFAETFKNNCDGAKNYLGLISFTFFEDHSTWGENYDKFIDMMFQAYSEGECPLGNFTKAEIVAGVSKYCPADFYFDENLDRCVPLIMEGVNNPIAQLVKAKFDALDAKMGCDGVIMLSVDPEIGTYRLIQKTKDNLKIYNESCTGGACKEFGEQENPASPNAPCVFDCKVAWGQIEGKALSCMFKMKAQPPLEGISECVKELLGMYEKIEEKKDKCEDLGAVDICTATIAVPVMMQGLSVYIAPSVKEAVNGALEKYKCCDTIPYKEKINELEELQPAGPGNEEYKPFEWMCGMPVTEELDCATLKTKLVELETKMNEAKTEAEFVAAQDELKKALADAKALTGCIVDSKYDTLATTTLSPAVDCTALKGQLDALKAAYDAAPEAQKAAKKASLEAELAANASAIAGCVSIDSNNYIISSEPVNLCAGETGHEAKFTALITKIETFLAEEDEGKENPAEQYVDYLYEFQKQYDAHEAYVGVGGVDCTSLDYENYLPLSCADYKKNLDTYKEKAEKAKAETLKKEDLDPGIVLETAEEDYKAQIQFLIDMYDYALEEEYTDEACDLTSYVTYLSGGEKNCAYFETKLAEITTQMDGILTGAKWSLELTNPKAKYEELQAELKALFDTEYKMYLATPSNPCSIAKYDEYKTKAYVAYTPVTCDDYKNKLAQAETKMNAATTEAGFKAAVTELKTALDGAKALTPVCVVDSKYTLLATAIWAPPVDCAAKYDKTFAFYKLSIQTAGSQGAVDVLTSQLSKTIAAAKADGCLVSTDTEALLAYHAAAIANCSAFDQEYSILAQLIQQSKSPMEMDAYKKALQEKMTAAQVAGCTTPVQLIGVLAAEFTQAGVVGTIGTITPVTQQPVQQQPVQPVQQYVAAQQPQQVQQTAQPMGMGYGMAQVPQGAVPYYGIPAKTGPETVVYIFMFCVLVVGGFLLRKKFQLK